MDVGANADAVAEACFNVIGECKKVNDAMRIGDSAGGGDGFVDDFDDVVNLAIEAR